MSLSRSISLPLLAAGAALMLTACSDDDVTTDSPVLVPPPETSVVDDVEVPGEYEFASNFVTGASSVSYSGQIFRHVLIADLKDFIGDLTEDVDEGDFDAAGEGDIVAALDFFYRFDSATSGDEEIGIETDPETRQKTYNDISSGKDLVGKTAGNDSKTDHQNWTDGDFAGWDTTEITQYGGGTTTPEQLILAYFETLEANAFARRDGDARHPVDGNGNRVTSQSLPVHLTESGLDLAQLVQKFLLGAVPYSQGTDDYFDDDVEGKGLLTSNAAADDPGKPYTTLEHQFDEGVGYFGAARDYLAYTDEEIAGKGGRDGYADGYHDTNGDGAIDLLSEYNFGNSVNAGKRDRGSDDAAKTDYTGAAMGALLEARAIISATVGRELLDDELAAVQTLRDQAVLAWEKAIAATVVHYINDTLQDMADFGSNNYSFADHAKHWSELKGFALGLQFNPRSQLTNDEFADFHDKVGDAPVLPSASAGEISAYKGRLLSARDLLQEAYGFADANMGDDDGEGGW